MSYTRVSLIIKRAARFSSLGSARRWAEMCRMWVVMGDHDGDVGVYWVVKPADAARLERVGYEIV